MLKTGNTDVKEEMLQSLSDELQKKFNAEDARKLEVFIRHYYAAVPEMDLEEKNLDDLYYSSFSCWKFIHSTNPGESKLRVFNPDLEQHGWQSSHTIVEILCKDIPFLVDSTRSLLSDMHFNIHTIHSSVFSIERNSQGKLVDFGPRSSVLSPPFDDYTDLLLKSVPEMELGWLEKVLATRRMESAGN